MRVDVRARSLLGLLAAILVVAGCNDTSGASQLLVEIVSPTGDNPALDVVTGSLTVQVRQGDRVLACGSGARCTSEILNGTFDLTFPIESFTEDTWIHASIDGAPTALVGATPIFSPFGENIDMGLAVRVVMGEPGTCQTLTVPGFSGGSFRLSSPRRDAAVVIRRNLAVVVGGTEAGGAGSDRAERLDQIVIQNLPLDPIPEGVGPARGLALTQDDSLILGDGRLIMYRYQTGPPLATEGAELHAGGGFASALTSLASMSPAGGVAIAGGLDGAAPVAEVTWLNATGMRTGVGALATARAFAVARDVPGALVVVGGAASGEPSAERFGGVESAGVPFDGVPEGSGGYLARSPSGRTLLWIGWADSSGAASMQTVLLRECATGCVVDPDPPVWDRARLDTAGIETAAGAFWIVGGTDSDQTDRVLWTEETPSFGPGPPLADGARAGAAAFEHASGIITVAGGEGPDGLRDDIELCFPDALDPI